MQLNIQAVTQTQQQINYQSYILRNEITMTHLHKKNGRPLEASFVIYLDPWSVVCYVRLLSCQAILADWFLAHFLLHLEKFHVLQELQ